MPVERYLIQREAGRGQRAIVFEAHDTLLQRRVAMKRGLDGVDERVLLQEAQRLARVRSPHVVAAYDLYAAPPTLVLEWLEGAPLRAHMSAARLEPARAHRVVAELFQALAAAHAVDVLHGDLKPENVWIEPTGNLKLFDFGATPRAGGDTTALYAAPEVLNGDAPGPSAEVYAAASIAFELLSGRPPFDGTDARELGRRKATTPAPSVRQAGGDAPESVEAWLRRALAPDPRARFATVAEAAQAWAGVAVVSSSPRRFTLQPFAHQQLQAIGRGGRLAPGHCVCIVGASGFGKTHLLRDLVAAHAGTGTRVQGWFAGVDGANGLEAAIATLLAAGRHEPTLLVVDAFESLAVGAQQQLLRLVQRSAVLGHMLVVAANPLRLTPDAAPRWCAFVDASSQQVHLRRPDLDGIRGLLAERLRTGNVSDSLAAFVLERSGANPRYALGIVDSLCSSGALQASGETWTFDPERAAADVPATLLPFLQTTLELVPAPARALLREAALYGVRFEPTLIAARLGLPAADVEARLHELALSTDVVTRTARGFEFVEPLFAAFLEQLTPPAERTALHRLHAELLVRRAPIDAAALGRHLFLAGDPRAALPYLARAAQEALAGQDPAQAKRLLELASRGVGSAADEAEAGRDVEILLAYAKLLDQAGASEIAIRHLENAVLLAQAWGLGVLEVRATRALGRVEYQRGHYDAAVERYHAAQACAARIGDEHEQQELALQLGNIHFERGQSDAALAAYGGALVYAAEHADADLEARASNNVALVESTLGRKDSAVRMFSRSLELFRALGRDDAVARTYHNIGMTYLDLHNPTEARVYFHKCMQLAEQIGLHEMLAVSCLEYAEASLQLGLTDEAGRTLQHALALCRERNDPLGVATAFRLLGSIAAAGGNHEAADTRLQQCIQTLQPLGPTPHLALALKERGRMLLEAGRAGSAEKALYEARDVLGAVDAHDIGAEVEELLQRCRSTSVRP